MKKYIFALLGASLLSGCVTVPLASPEADQQAKKFIVPTDKAALYVYRNSILGTALRKIIKVDGKVIGKNAPFTYFYKLLPPGSHTVTAYTALWGDHDYKIDMQKGKIYCLQEYMIPALPIGTVSLGKMPLDTCKEAIQSLKLIKNYQ